MKIKVLAFGIVKDIFERPSIEIDVYEGADVAFLKSKLEEAYPQLLELKSFLVARNNEYTKDGDRILKNDEIALIPPVSGG